MIGCLLVLADWLKLYWPCLTETLTVLIVDLWWCVLAGAADMSSKSDV
jgi:hypothetical protein